MLIKASDVVEKLYSGSESAILTALNIIQKLDASGRAQLSEVVRTGTDRQIFCGGSCDLPANSSEPDVPFVALCIRKRIHLNECFTAVAASTTEHLDVLAMLLTVPEEILSNLVIPDEQQRQPVLTHEAFGLDFTAKNDSLSKRLHVKPKKFATTLH
ncbi:MAG: hypothetical protein C5B53_09910 [Candidatus Melainabacteria bacterium]|nr:MAG: hypothetical protein C5B53_09910 [Candidatus Melainabacteria bacterium]